VWVAVSTWACVETIRRPSRIEPSQHLGSGFFIVPRSLQLCLSQPAQKTLLGGVRSAEFPQGGLECSRSPSLDREIAQVRQQSDGLVVFIRLPFLALNRGSLNCLRNWKRAWTHPGLQSCWAKVCGNHFSDQAYRLRAQLSILR
jgi:hypothetical protein